MCGITGYFSPLGSDGVDSIECLMAMADLISHRGPNDSGVWHDGHVGLAHRRLSIQDLSGAGHQPMHSPCGRYVLIFNGEIYNHMSMREELDELYPVWKGSSDSETLLIALAHWGLEITLKKLVGMFAFALWDKAKQKLTLARDRMGEKPLYWGWAGNTFLFSSELKALKGHPDFKSKIDRKALALFLKYSYVPSPHSIYDGIYKLQQGHYITIPIDVSKAKSVSSIAYWDLSLVASEAVEHPFEGTPEQAIDAVEQQLRHTIADQMLADVPLGAFLSGGVDSSTVVSLMQEFSDRPVKTYTIGFKEKGYNEANHAKVVAEHLGTEHTELYVDANDALSIIPNLANIYCEPFADSSQIPTFLVSKLARSEVTVALSGDGGDELFGGYNRYLAANRVWKPMQKVPIFARRILASTATMLSEQQVNRLFDRLHPILPEKLRISMPGEKLHKLSSVLSLNSGHEFYNSLVTSWKNPENLVVAIQEDVDNGLLWQDLDCIEHSMMLADAKTYMVDDILVKVDRAAMATSLETRVPLLDHRIVELAWSMPIDYKIRNGQGKWLLREVLYRRVPRELIERPKAGFSLPLDSWLRGPLRDWAEDLLSPDRLYSDGYLKVTPIRKAWEEHVTGKYNNQELLWNVLMFQSWLEYNK